MHCHNCIRQENVENNTDCHQGWDWDNSRSISGCNSHLITGVMGAGKLEIAIIMYDVLTTAVGKGICISLNGTSIISRTGGSLDTIFVSDFLKIYKVGSDDLPAFLIIDEYQFLSTDQIDQILNRRIKTNFKGKLWETYEYLIDSGATENQKSKPCDKCHNHLAEHNILLDPNNNIVRDGDTVVPELKENFIALCTRCVDNVWINGAKDNNF